MSATDLERRLQDAIAQGVADSFESVTCDRYIVYVPVMFPDGDHPVVLLKRRRGKWRLTDDGNTLMRLDKGSIEVTTPAWPDDAGFANTLRNFADALLLIESARHVKDAPAVII